MQYYLAVVHAGISVIASIEIGTWTEVVAIIAIMAAIIIIIRGISVGRV